MILETISTITPVFHAAHALASSYPDVGSEVVATAAYTPGIGDFNYSGVATDNVGGFLTDNGPILAVLVGIFIVVNRAPHLVRRFAR